MFLKMTVSNFLITLYNFQEDDGYESRNTGGGPTSGGTKRRSWDDEFVLKGQFSALIPAFDPRPGRVNVNQTTDLDVPAPGPDNSSDQAPLLEQTSHRPKLQLHLKGPNIPGVIIQS